MNNLAELNSNFQEKLSYLTREIEPLLKEKNNLLFSFLDGSGVSNIEDETDLETQYGYFLKSLFLLILNIIPPYSLKASIFIWSSSEMVNVLVPQKLETFFSNLLKISL